MTTSHVLETAEADIASSRRSEPGRSSCSAEGWGAGIAAFIAMTSWQGEYTDEYFAQPAPDPGPFGMPALEADG